MGQIEISTRTHHIMENYYYYYSIL
uniref:Uncharacterized protein n=1 Tax=Anguilla anguilla TaxID=7936 RepID=A0A0E9TBK1_ANGAN